ncbi:hypothetical protein AAMO2058_001650100 [Amorphochlora amoebiformis]
MHGLTRVPSRARRSSRIVTAMACVVLLSCAALLLQSKGPSLSASAPIRPSGRTTAPKSPLVRRFGPTRRNTKVNSEAAASADQSAKASGEELNIPQASKKGKNVPEVGRPATPILDMVKNPKNLKNLNMQQLKQLSKEIRSDVIHTVSKTGGHLGASLGVVELTTALHYVFNSPEDKILWDVGHQAYPHKILTGRRDRMHTLRQDDGLSGFTNRFESEHDPFGAGHSSTSISAGLGMAVGRDFAGRKNHVVSVIGDGAITAGMAYEGMNHAGFLDSNQIIILNDNKQVSLPTQYNGGNQAPVGALSGALTRLQANQPLRELREIAKGISKQLPGPIPEAAARIDEYARGIIAGGPSSLFEELGLYYIGPVDGHNLEDLVKNTETPGPVIIHVVTEKGKGYAPAETASDKMHGVVKFDVATGRQNKKAGKTDSYTNYFADSLIAEAEKDPKVVGIHAAMGGGTGLNRFAKKFPERCFDVGIAEQHAVTFAAGLACEGIKPMCAIYSTFLQRAYDQVVHDVALQNLPVRFAIDRAGPVGADGATHAGSFDLSYLGCVPNMVIMAPSNEAELINMVATSIAYDEGPSAFRFPRGNGIGVDLEKEGIVGRKGTPMEIGKAKLCKSGKDVALVGIGNSVNECLLAADILDKEFGVSATVVDARFCKPIDENMMKQLAKEHPALLTVEENSIGGFGSQVTHYLCHEGLLDGGLKLRPLILPDFFIEHGHGTKDNQIDHAGLSAKHIVNHVLGVLERKDKNFELPSESTEKKDKMSYYYMQDERARQGGLVDIDEPCE